MVAVLNGKMRAGLTELPRSRLIGGERWPGGYLGEACPRQRAQQVQGHNGRDSWHVCAMASGRVSGGNEGGREGWCLGSESGQITQYL